MIVKVHETPDGKKIIAICDSNLIGKVIEEKDLQLDLSSNFYKGEEKHADDIKKMIYDAYMVNIVGKDSIKLGLEVGIIMKENVIKVCDVPHAQAILM
ncbi:MAG: DUF424 family protein [bacterium]|nr:DUF424 family protein [bacterium]